MPNGLKTALLLGAMLIVGLNPGPEMLKSRLDVTFSMVWVLIISNIIVAALCFLILNHLAALTFIRGTLLIPFLMFLVFIGSFTANNDLNDIIATLLFRQQHGKRAVILRGGIRAHEQGHHVGARRVRDPRLGARHDVIFAFAHGLCAQRAKI